MTGRATLFVAEFIGSPSMNLIEGQVTSVADGRATLRLGPAEVVVAAPPGLEAGRPVTVGIRPEHLTLADAGLPATVRVVEPTGSETHVVLDFRSQEITAVFRERHQLRHGDTVHLAVDTEYLHHFDAATAERIG